MYIYIYISYADLGSLAAADAWLAEKQLNWISCTYLPLPAAASVLLPKYKYELGTDLLSPPAPSCLSPSSDYAGERGKAEDDILITATAD